MTNGPFDEPDDASTPLTADEKKGLIPTYITTRGELNQAEQKNIFKAQRWAFQRRRDVLDENFMRALHKRMFREVWEWAGAFRTSPRNIGIEPCDIAPELRKLLDDAKVQIRYASYPPDEVASRFHYRLVTIHPFPDGNGRHGRRPRTCLPCSSGKNDSPGAAATGSPSAPTEPATSLQYERPTGLISGRCWPS